MKLSERLKAAKAKIADPARLARFVMRDKQDRVCAIGALCDLEKIPVGMEYLPSAVRDDVDKDIDALLAASMQLFNTGVTVVNNYGDHKDVMAMYDKAIETAEAAGD